jgi:glycosyltransferase involved in cell wall biosynthesis
MRVLILLPGYSANDDDWAIPVQRHLLRELSQHADVRVLTLRYPHRRDRYSIDGVPVTSLGWGQVRGVKRLLLWRDALATIRTLYREQPFDLLHAMWADETGALAAWAGQRLGVPSVVSLLGGELARLDEIAYGLQRGRFSRWIVGQALRADAITSPATYIDGLLRHAGYAVPPARLHRWILGVDTTHFTPDHNIAHTSRRLIAVGSLIPVKDHATLLHALPLLDDALTLDLLGEGVLRGALERLADELRIRQRVRFLGSVSHLDLPTHYRRAALHILPSRHEANPMALLEAAACGLPTVGSPVGILPDDARLGLAVPAGDAAALAAAIRQMLSEPSARQGTAQAATGSYSTGTCVRHLQALYQSLKLA